MHILCSDNLLYRCEVYMNRPTEGENNEGVISEGWLYQCYVASDNKHATAFFMRHKYLNPYPADHDYCRF